MFRFLTGVFIFSALSLGSNLASATAAIRCSDVFFPVHTWMLQNSEILSGKSDSQLYIEESKRTFLAEAMRTAGYTGVKGLLEGYAGSIRADSTVLEIGPFLNPLAHEFARDHRLVFWEFDSDAAQKIMGLGLPPDKLNVFQIDLKLLDVAPGRWDDFLNRNKMALAYQGAESEKLGAAIMSSVLNYLNFKVVLQKVVGLMEEDGILFIGNSNGGTARNYFSGSALMGPEILEFLMTAFPTSLTILDGAQMINDPSSTPFAGPVSRITMAVKVNTARASSADFYDRALDLYLDGINNEGRGSLTNRSWWDLWSDIGTIPAMQLRAAAKDPKLAPEQREQAEQRWVLAREELKKLYALKIAAQVRKVKAAVYGSDDWSDIKWGEMQSESSKYQLIPERQILLQALEIRDQQQRAIFIDAALAQLYRDLNHVP